MVLLPVKEILKSCFGFYIAIDRVSVSVKIIRSNPVRLVAGLAEFGQGGRLFGCNFLQHGSTDVG